MQVGSVATDELADRIYEASVMPDLWPDVLRDLASVADSSEAIVFAMGEPGIRSVSSSAEFTALAPRHFEYPGGHERTRRLLALQRAGFATDREVFTEEEFANEPLFTDFLIPLGFGRGVATAVEVPQGDTIVIHAEGPFSRGTLAPKVLRALNELRPHLARSALISARLAFEKARGAVETLAGLGMAACAVSGAGVVIVANSEFERDTAYWTTRLGGVIALQDKRANAMLAESLQSLAHRAAVRSLPIVPQAGEAPAALHVVPVRRSAHDLFANTSAILVLTRASSEPTSATPLLRVLFDLSPAEAEVAAAIAAGETIERFALLRGRSQSTVRNQVKSVLAKTGCSRQADLARVVAQLLPGRPGPQAT
jgi:DNA-binding CsgD family transcriptional regulator